MTVNGKQSSPRLSYHHLEKLIIDEEYHHFTNARVTVCCLLVASDFSVVASVVCANPDQFDKQIGRVKARQKALSKLMKYERYRHRQQFGDVGSKGDAGP